MTGKTRSKTHRGMSRLRGIPRLIRGVWSRLAGANRWISLVAGVLSLAALLAVSSALLTTPPAAVLAVGLSQSPPFMYLNEKGEAAGALPDLLTAAARRAGTKLRWVVHPQGVDSAMSPGSGIDIWPIAEVTAARRERFHITQPFARGDVLLVRLAGQSDVPIRKLGLKNWPEAHAWARRKYPGAQPEVRGQGSGLHKLCEGKLDATLVETPVFDAFLLKRPPACATARFQITMLDGFGTEYGLASTSQAAGAADLLRQKLGEMAREGKFDEVFQRYYPLAHYRSAESFAETRTEKSYRLFRWGAAALFVLCVLLWIALHRFRRRADEAVAMADLRSRFLASISHELRTPLNGVLGIASVLSSTPLDRTQREYVGLIRSSGETLLRTVNEVLDFSRLEAGKRSLSQGPVHMESLVEDILSILAPVAYQKDLELAWVVDRGVPAAIESDETALRQIFMNLLGNALKFTERGTVSLRIQHEPLDREAAMLRIVVSDSGPGIPRGQESSIFDPYIRSDNASTQAAVGTGLGLSITKQLVLLLGGTIRVANDPSGGCAFTVDLPITPASEVPVLEPRCDDGSPLPKHAMILARDAITGDMLERRLEEAGCRVTRFYDMESAARAGETGGPWDLLVIDAGVNGDSVEIARTLRRGQDGHSARVILLATGKQEADALSRRAPKDYVVFPKPFLSELFCSALEKLASQSDPKAPPVAEGSGTHAAPSSPRSFPAGLLELQRATQPPAALPPDCLPDGKGCEVCSRDNTRSIAACVAAALPSAGAPRVLVADDNPVNLKVVSSLLRSMGIPCDAVDDGHAALRSFSAATYSWIVMDWHMPGMDGLAAIEMIRQRERRDGLPRTPIILCTATNEQDDRLAGWEDSFEGILPKPISLKSLRKALILSARRVQGSLATREQATRANVSPLPSTPPE